MALTQHYHTKFEQGRFYHIYNRTVDKQPLFRSDENCAFFLSRYEYYLSPVVETYAYCLLGNHFHLLVGIKDLTDFRNGERELQKSNELTDHDIISRQFRKFFQSYSMAFNKQHNRIGTLFQTPFKRALVDNDHYFAQLVYYIHANPQTHGLIDDFKRWSWSSYNRILVDKPTKLMKNEVINWFGNKEAYIDYHNFNRKLLSGRNYILEDD